ncbi:hypothetical protein BJX61DRAFT_546579 [Aspergillus egyptiacus]|nr:hypothetical protein BJX61DRAFT_546579 [Aspergillus egyptiacus]
MPLHYRTCRCQSCTPIPKQALGFDGWIPLTVLEAPSENTVPVVLQCEIGSGGENPLPPTTVYHAVRTALGNQIKTETAFEMAFYVKIQPRAPKRFKCPSALISAMVDWDMNRTSDEEISEVIKKLPVVPGSSWKYEILRTSQCTERTKWFKTNIIDYLEQGATPFMLYSNRDFQAPRIGPRDGKYACLTYDESKCVTLEAMCTTCRKLYDRIQSEERSNPAPDSNSALIWRGSYPVVFECSSRKPDALDRLTTLVDRLREAAREQPHKGWTRKVTFHAKLAPPSYSPPPAMGTDIDTRTADGAQADTPVVSVLADFPCPIRRGNWAVSSILNLEEWRLVTPDDTKHTKFASNRCRYMYGDEGTKAECHSSLFRLRWFNHHASSPTYMKWEYQ